MPIRIRHTAAGSQKGIAVPSRTVSAQSLPGHLDPQKDQHTPPFLSLREAADWLCVSLSTLKRLIAKGELSTVRIGARQKIPASHLAAYIAKDVLLPSQAATLSQT
jgi:excisionase family DNA binding protein